MSFSSLHRKVSTWPASTNLARIRAAVDWNDEHVYRGGAHGSLMVRDTSRDGLADAKGADWQTKAAFDVRDDGAVGDGSTDDTTAIQTTITKALAARGGCVDFPPGNYRISAALQIQALAAGIGVTLRGAGMFSTTITQVTAGADVFAFGETDHEHGDYMGARDLTTVGGRRALSLNNCLHGHWKRLRLTGAQVGLYTQGQCESHFFKSLYCINNTLHGIHAGNTNGGHVNPDGGNYPILAKSVFDHVQIVGTTGGTACLISAGVIDGVQQVSGGIYFRRLIFDTNGKDGLVFEYAVNVSIDGLGSEDYLDADNTYDFLTARLGSVVSIRNAYIGHASFGGVGNFRYYVNADATVSIEDSNLAVGGAAGTKDVRVGDTLNLTNCTVTDGNAILFPALTLQRSTLTSVRDSSNVLIRWPWDYAVATPLTGANVFMDLSQRRLILNPAGTLATLTVYLPSTPLDGQVASVSSSQIITALTLTPGGAGPSVVGAPTSLAAGQGIAMIYNTATTTWFPA